jgi:hypothetical protein
MRTLVLEELARTTTVARHLTTPMALDQVYVSKAALSPVGWSFSPHGLPSFPLRFDSFSGVSGHRRHHDNVLKLFASYFQLNVEFIYLAFQCIYANSKDGGRDGR